MVFECMNLKKSSYFQHNFKETQDSCLLRNRKKDKKYTESLDYSKGKNPVRQRLERKKRRKK